MSPVITDPLVPCPRGCSTMVRASQVGKPHTATRLDDFGDIVYYTCR